MQTFVKMLLEEKEDLYQSGIEGIQKDIDNINANFQEWKAHLELESHNMMDITSDLLDKFMEEGQCRFDAFAHHLQQVNPAVLVTLDDTIDEHIGIWPLLVLCLGGAICLFCSAMFHLLIGYNKVTFDALVRVDLAGISFLVLASFFPPVVFTFYCNERVLLFYLSVCFVLCSSTLVFSMLPLKQMQELRQLRVIAYVAAGGFSLAPLAQIAMTNGIDSAEMELYTNHGNLFYVLLLYLLGAIIYVFRVPERWYPGKFDLFMASHQLWHALVFAAAILHYKGSVNQFEWRRENMCANETIVSYYY